MNIIKGEFNESYQYLLNLWTQGYAASDIIQNLFKIVKSYRSAAKTEPELDEYLRLEFVKEIGFVQMRIVTGLNTFLQLSGLLARLCSISLKFKEKRK